MNLQLGWHFPLNEYQLNDFTEVLSHLIHKDFFVHDRTYLTQNDLSYKIITIERLFPIAIPRKSCCQDP